MGSSGHGKFGNYSERQNYGNNYGNSNVYGHSNYEEGGNFICPTEINTIRLENVETSQFFLENQTVPNTGDLVFLSPTIHQGRLVVVHSETNYIIGNMPISHNYLVKCLNHNYNGEVISSGIVPIPFVVVNLHA